MEDDLSYYIRRELAEHELAERATDEKSRQSHLALAASYAEIIKLLRGESDTPWTERNPRP